MTKLIIDNKSDLPMESVLRMCAEVVEEGRISNDGKQYCYATVFRIGGVNYGVVSELNKKSDRFIIYKEDED